MIMPPEIMIFDYYYSSIINDIEMDMFAAEYGSKYYNNLLDEKSALVNEKTIKSKDVTNSDIEIYKIYIKSTTSEYRGMIREHIYNFNETYSIKKYSYEEYKEKLIEHIKINCIYNLI